MINWKKWCAIPTVLICFFIIINMIAAPDSQASSGSEPSEADIMAKSLSPVLGYVDTPQDLQETTTITTIHIMPAIKTLLLK